MIVIRVKSFSDAVQLDDDLEDEFTKKLREIFGPEVSINPNRKKKGDWLGKSISLKSLGPDEKIPVLGVIAIRDDAERRESVIDHEYAHRQYRDIIKPFLHHYLSNGKLKLEYFAGRINKLSETTKSKLMAALGEISTENREENADRKLWDALNHEHELLNELRAYSFSHGVTVPNDRITDLKMEKAKYPGENGYIDPEMARRYLQLHLLLTKSYVTSQPHAHGRVVCILGAAQSLSQAIRLIQEKLDNPGGFNSAEHFAEYLNFIAQIASGRVDDICSYRIGDVEIPKQEVITTLLIAKEKFEEAAKEYGNGMDAEEVEAVRILYN